MRVIRELSNTSHGSIQIHLPVLAIDIRMHGIKICIHYIGCLLWKLLVH